MKITYVEARTSLLTIRYPHNGVVQYIVVNSMKFEYILSFTFSSFNNTLLKHCSSKLYDTQQACWANLFRNSKLFRNVLIKTR